MGTKPYLQTMLCVVLTLTFAVPGSAAAYVLRHTDGGEVIRWHGSEIALRFDSSLGLLGDHGEVESAIERSLDTWEASGVLPPTFAVESTHGAELGYRPDQSNHNDVLAVGGPWPFDRNYTAVTVATYNAETGELLDADIAFDASRTWSAAGAPAANATDVRDTATHEIGHLLGLAHSDVPAATMFAEGPPGTTARRSLHNDDLSALVAAYGDSGQLKTARAGCSAAPGVGNHIAEMWLVAGLLLVGWIRRGIR